MTEAQSIRTVRRGSAPGLARAETRARRADADTVSAPSRRHRPPGDLRLPGAPQVSPARRRSAWWCASATPGTAHRAVRRRGAAPLVEERGRDGDRDELRLSRPWQRELQAALPVPVWTSSLLLLRGLERPGVVTVDSGVGLSAEHLRAAGADAATRSGRGPGCALQRTLLDDLPELDARGAERRSSPPPGACCAAPGARRHRPGCTNLPPYADAVRRATGPARPRHHDLDRAASAALRS